MYFRGSDTFSSTNVVCVHLLSHTCAPSRFMESSALWFLFTLAYAVMAAQRKLYRAHKTWMLRHIASGIWWVIACHMYHAKKWVGVTEHPPVWSSTSTNSIMQAIVLKATSGPYVTSSMLDGALMRALTHAVNPAVPVLLFIARSCKREHSLIGADMIPQAPLSLKLQL